MQSKDTALLPYLFLLTGFFCLVQISFLLQGTGIYLGDIHVVADKLTIPWRVWPPVVFYVFVQFVLHVLFTLVIWSVARSSAALLQLSWPATQWLGYSLWAVSLFAVLFANAHFYPHSKFADLLYFFMNTKAINITFYVLMIILSGFACLYVARMLMRGFVPVLRCGPYGLLFIIIFLPFYLFKNPEVASPPLPSQQPNIIIIGIDSLRPNIINTEDMPALQSYLDNSIVFTDALTPQARTFPSWVSILTGRYPSTIGVRFDLADSQHLDFNSSLAAILQQKGYHTIYATDETRFSNITSQMGFQKIIAPPMGANDFFDRNLK